MGKTTHLAVAACRLLKSEIGEGVALVAVSGYPEVAEEPISNHMGCLSKPIAKAKIHIGFTKVDG